MRSCGTILHASSIGPTNISPKCSGWKNMRKSDQMVGKKESSAWKFQFFNSSPTNRLRQHWFFIAPNQNWRQLLEFLCGIAGPRFLMAGSRQSTHYCKTFWSVLFVLGALLVQKNPVGFSNWTKITYLYRPMILMLYVFSTISILDVLDLCTKCFDNCECNFFLNYHFFLYWRNIVDDNNQWTFL